MNDTPKAPDGRPIQSDPYFDLLAEAGWAGVVRCGDVAVLAVILSQTQGER